MGMAQPVKRHLQSKLLGELAPGRAEGVRGLRGAVPGREDQIAIAEFALPERETSLEQALALRVHNVADDSGKCNVANAGLALWRFESQPGLGFLETFTNVNYFVLEIHVAPAQRENLTTSQTGE